STGEASVDATRQLKPDLVLMDVNLPGINGLDATRRILRDSNGVVVVLLLSTYDEEDYASKAAECGASAYIAKSRFDPDRLTAAWATATKPSVNSSHDPGPSPHPGTRDAEGARRE